MSYKTLEVELEDGRVHPRNCESLPRKATALLTILDQVPISDRVELPPPSCGLQRLLSNPDFQLTRQQFETTMHLDFWEQ